MSAQDRAVMRRDVAFPGEDGLTLRAWLYAPDIDGPRPAITMANGYGGTRRHGMEGFANAFAKAGFVVLLHDHRNFGDSEAVEPGDVDPWRQIADWRRAISFLETLDSVDPRRIGLWGASYAGGHAIVLGASDRRLRAVVAQTPAITGGIDGLRGVVPDPSSALDAAFARDDRARLAGQPGARLPLIVSDAQARAPHSDPEAAGFYAAPSPSGRWTNTVTLRSARAARLYEPGVLIGRIAPTPFLMILAREDAIAIPPPSLAAFHRAGQPKRLVMLEGGHFASYQAQLRPASQAAIDWFRVHLMSV